MSGVSKLISDKLYSKVQEDLQVCKGKGDISWKLQAIKSAKEHDISSVAKIFGISRVTLNEWISSYKAEGVSGLKLKPGRGRKPIITKGEEAAITKWLEEDSSTTGKMLIERIRNELGKEIGKTTANELMHKLGFSYITPRPKHHKQNKEAQEAFKKNLRTKIEANPDKELLFFDESRFGTHSKLGHGWFRRGKRTAVAAKLGLWIACV